ncbi:hypothetical protein B0T17DRAFT_485394 [Bombardia bombarda]|uniref:ATP-dependent DNA ligase family profile domain-containing protein n=1 Tax=Bombardia bombarda TaxID=252184 RepID=A0AA39XLC3_9PEZI|nr:hypothetical protein B0T17DRAFT_485394 [Bombardia bombarda]
MPFPFSYVCDLLQRLEDNQRGARGVLRGNADLLREWFGAHCSQFLCRDDHDDAALLSTLLPEKRTDRIYLIREKKLQATVGRALGLGVSRIMELGRWSRPGSGVDLAECVEGVLKETPNPISPANQAVTVEEIDGLLHSIASACRFSSPAVRSSAAASSFIETRLTDRELALGNLYTRLSSRDAKWLTRLILKNFEPVVLDPQMVYHAYNPVLPVILKVQDDFVVAGRILASQRRDRTVVGRPNLAEYMKPTLGVKVGRQPWIKGRSIKHCLDMGHGRMSVEEKLDGEYCQIHIDLSKDRDCIQIFSKSGKDSTRDRAGLHGSIRESLQLGQPSCPLKKGCILEGELVVYSNKDEKILDFYKIRKHLSRSGTFIGTDQDSQTHHWEHLMIVYYDVLMIDDESLLAVKHSERFQRLKQLVTVVEGRSELVKRQAIDCDRPSARSDLRHAFAKCITSRGEGLVLKSDDPYFDFDSARRPYSCCAIKLKKEYVSHFGDIGDFAVVGARFDAAKSRFYSIPNLKWTHFFVGCLENKDEVVRFRRKPRFVVTNVVELNISQLETFVTFVNPIYVPAEENDAISLRIEPGIDDGKRPSFIFPVPPVFDLRCFSFDKAGNTGFWSPRFPMVNKIHCDRTYHDTLSFAELQDMAVKEKELPPPEDSQELLGWIAALENADPKSAAGHIASQSTASQLSERTMSTPATPSTIRSECGQSQVSPSLPISRGNVISHIRSHSAIVQGTFGGPLTPPRSSLIRPSITQANSPERATNRTTVTRGLKRPIESPTKTAPDRCKIRRCSNDPAMSVVVPLSQGEDTSPDSSSSQREPLLDVSVSSSRRNTVASSSAVPPRLCGSSSMYQLEHVRAPPPKATLHRAHTASISFSGVSTTLPSRPETSHHNYPHVKDRSRLDHPSSTAAAVAKLPSNNTVQGGRGGQRCRYLPETCTLSSYFFLLSPCIADYPWVTEDLLSCHGVTSYARHPKEWSSTTTTTTTITTTANDGNEEMALQTAISTENNNIDTRRKQKQKRKRKVVLVDSRRKEATAAFLKSTHAAQLKRRNGEREYVPVFDWRVLEALREEEERCGKTSTGISGEREREKERERAGRLAMGGGAKSLWKKFWVGLA